MLTVGHKFYINWLARSINYFDYPGADQLKKKKNAIIKTSLERQLLA